MKNVNFVVEGFGADTGSVSIPIDDAQADSALDTLVNGVSAGWVKKRSVTSSPSNLAGSTPTAEETQVEMGLRLYWTDNVTGRSGYFTIPAPDWAALTISGNDVTLQDASVMANLVNFLNTNGRSPIDDNPITISSAKIVGR